MTLREALREAERNFRAAEIADARFDALCLAQKAFQMDATQLRLHGETACESASLAEYRALAHRRAAGEPLQYILGEWEFYSMPFFVGPGVLIPRPETELLTAAALRFLEGKPDSAVVYDLCAGSGCVGLSVAARRPGATVFLAEIMPEALKWLRLNAQRHTLPNARVAQWDVLAPPPKDAPTPDVILTNPPYIPGGELRDLAKEVQQEPRTALDGGEDGLKFYRAIERYWLPRLRMGGLLAAECGDGQATQVAAILTRATQGKAEVIKDANGLERMVVLRP